MEKNDRIYTLRELILAVRKEYMKQLVELKKLESLVIPISRKADKVEFKLSGSIMTSDIVCETIKKISKLDELLKRTDRVVLNSYSISSCDKIPYFVKDEKEFEDIKRGIELSDYYNKMKNIINFNDRNDDCLLQMTVEDIRLLKADYNGAYKEITFRDADSLYLSNNTEIADAYNMLNIHIPVDKLDQYHIDIMDQVKNPHSLRIVDVRKKDTIKYDSSPVLLAKRRNGIN